MSTWGNATWLHLVPVVNKSKPVSPCCTPDWEPWKANQSMVALTLWPQPPRKIQAWNPLVVTCSTQIKAESCTCSDLFPWLIEANTLTEVPLEKLLSNDTDSQRKSPFFRMTSFPFWTPAVDKANETYQHLKLKFFRNALIYDLLALTDTQLVSN